MRGAALLVLLALLAACGADGPPERPGGVQPGGGPARPFALDPPL